MDEPLLVVKPRFVYSIVFVCQIETDPLEMIALTSKLSFEGKLLGNEAFPRAIHSTDCFTHDGHGHYYSVKKDIDITNVPVGTMGFVDCRLGAETKTVYFEIRSKKVSITARNL